MSICLKLKKSAAVLFSLLLCGAVLYFSASLRQGVLIGLRLCSTAVIPSLFLFTAAALFAVKCKAADTIGRLVSPVTQRCLRLNGNEATVFLISTVAGYPVGAGLINTLYRDGKITRQKALKMLTFSVNAGPAFIITVVGETVLNCRSDGVRLLTIHILATLISAVGVSLLPDCIFSKSPDSAPPTDRLTAERPCLSDQFVLSVAEAGKTMLRVCVFVVFFSAIGYAVSRLPLSFSSDFGALLEVTSGLKACTRKTLPKAAFLLGFGGVSVIFQVKSAVEKVNPSISLLFISRLVHGSTSAGLCLLAEQLFPRSLSTGSFNIQPSGVAVHTSPIASIALMLMCVVLIGFCEKQKA